MSEHCKNDRNSEQYFERLSAQSSMQNSIHLAIEAVAEIVVIGCSCVLALLTTGKSDYDNCPLNFHKISKSLWAIEKCLACQILAGSRMLDIPDLVVLYST